MHCIIGRDWRHRMPRALATAQATPASAISDVFCRLAGRAPDYLSWQRRAPAEGVPFPCTVTPACQRRVARRLATPSEQQQGLAGAQSEGGLVPAPGGVQRNATAGYFESIFRHSARALRGVYEKAPPCSCLACSRSGRLPGRMKSLRAGARRVRPARASTRTRRGARAGETRIALSFAQALCPGCGRNRVAGYIRPTRNMQGAVEMVSSGPAVPASCWL
jgi:hypothetical protein